MAGTLGWSVGRRGSVLLLLRSLSSENSRKSLLGYDGVGAVKVLRRWKRPCRVRNFTNSPSWKESHCGEVS